MSVNFPSGAKIYGANIIPTATQANYGGGGHAWTQLYLNWNWTGWVKPQIDTIIGNSVGCNCFRLIGGNFGVINGTYSQAYYDALIMQVATYLQSIGAYFYAGVGAIDNDTVYNNLSTTAASAASTLLKIQGLGNVIGCDVIQEAQSGGFSPASLSTLLSGIRNAGVTIPLTCSTSYTTNPNGADIWLPTVQQYFDYIDTHIYYTPPVPDVQIPYLRATYPNQDLLFGEFGMPQAYTQDQRNTLFSRVLTLANAADTKMRGSLIWACSDQDVVNTNEYGLYDASFNPRSCDLANLRAFTGGSLAKSLATHR